MGKILVIGASGFVGRHLAQALLAGGHEVRCMARNPARVQDLERIGCEVVRGDISEPESLRQALESVRAAYVSVHTLSPQHASTAGREFMEIEMDGLRNVAEACVSSGVRRLIDITSLGITPDAPSAWVRGRWEAEQFLLNTGLDVTVIRPGQIVGRGGAGFGMTVGQAKRRVALVLGRGQKKMQNIAIDDLVYYLVGVLDDPRAYGRCYDVGGDDILTQHQMIDVVADCLGRPHPIKIPVPRAILGVLAPLFERMGKLPRGAIRGILDALDMDLTGDPLPIRTILPRPPRSYRQAVGLALTTEKLTSQL